MHDSDGKFNEIVQRIALHWQLKPHFVARHGKKLMYGPADLEGHMGKDGRYYILDTARLFPPHPPVEGVRYAQSQQLSIDT